MQIAHNFIFVFLYGLAGGNELGGYTYDIIANVQFWFSLMIMLAISLIPVIISRKIDLHFSHNIVNNIRNKRFEDDYLRKTYLKKLENMSRCTRSLAKFKKIYKVEDNYIAENYADKKMKEFVELYKALRKTKNSEEIETFNRHILRRTKSEKTKPSLFKAKLENVVNNSSVLNLNPISKWNKNVENVVEEERKEVSFISAKVDKATTDDFLRKMTEIEKDNAGNDN